MNLTVRRTIAAAATSVALVAPAVMVQSAEATPPEHSKSAEKKPSADKPAKDRTKQLVKAIAGKDRRLARLATADRTTRLGEENEAAVVGNIAADRELLAAVKADAESADSTMDVNVVRKHLRSLRVENYVLVVNVLRKAEALETEAAADPEAVALLASAVEKARAITATSTKADVKAARADLRAAQAELDPEDDPELDPEDDPEVPETEG